MQYDEFRKRYDYDPDKDELGEGGFGRVFRAYDTYMDVHVAIKRCEVKKKDDDKLSLRNEAEMASRLPPHANIARYEACHRFRVGDVEFDYGVLQYYKDGNLLDVLERERLTHDDIGGILRQILQGLHFLHGPAAGVIHRDLKPRNILMVRREGGEWVPKITDFGISKKIDASQSRHTNTLVGAGTLTYMSPEQMEHGTGIRPNTDLWSFGVIAYQAFTGEKPFAPGERHSSSDSGRIDLMRRIHEARLPGAINNVPEPWRRLIRLCLEPDPDKRIRSAAECFDVLGLDAEGNPGPLPAGPDGPDRPGDRLPEPRCPRCGAAVPRGGAAVPRGGAACPSCGQQGRGQTGGDHGIPGDPGVPAARGAAEGYAWAIALVALASFIFQTLAASDAVAVWCAIYLAGFAICAVLIGKDFEVMEKSLNAEHAHKKLSAGLWVAGGALLAPAYLFRRASHTDRRYGPFALCAIVFVLNLAVGGARLAGAQKAPPEPPAAAETQEPQEEDRRGRRRGRRRGDRDGATEHAPRRRGDRNGDRDGATGQPDAPRHRGDRDGDREGDRSGDHRP